MPYKLDEKTHKIYIDAPSVTTIVNEVYPFDTSAINPKYLKMGQDKGTCVHKQIEMYIKYGSKIGCTCKKQVKTHIDQGKWLCDWWNKYSAEKDIAAVEPEKIMVVVNDKLELTGIADLIVYEWSQGAIKTTIIDWKTTKDTHKEKEAIQVYLYGLLLANGDLDNWFIEHQNQQQPDHMIVNSNKKTSYELTPEQMEQGKQDALKGLQLYKEKRDKNIWK